jgi:hypothetical protein
MIVAALSLLIERSCLAYDAGKPAPVSSIFRSKIGEDLTAVAVGDNNKLVRCSLVNKHANYA